jgi:hypothetical protein
MFGNGVNDLVVSDVAGVISDRVITHRPQLAKDKACLTRTRFPVHVYTSLLEQIPLVRLKIVE